MSKDGHDYDTLHLVAKVSKFEVELRVLQEYFNELRDSLNRNIEEVRQLHEPSSEDRVLSSTRNSEDIEKIFERLEAHEQLFLNIFEALKKEGVEIPNQKYNDSKL